MRTINRRLTDVLQFLARLLNCLCFKLDAKIFLVLLLYLLDGSKCKFLLVQS